MIRSLFCLAVCFSTSAIAFADDKEDLKASKGSWNVTKAVFMGTESTDIFKTAVLTIEDEKYTVKIGDMEDKGTVKIDSSKKPKRMTITSTEGVNKGKVFEAIYELDGDKMKVCYMLEGKDPPTAFESKEGTQTLYIEYKREKK
jgi:uncharacterized protein (TIGR03067 family)